MLRYRCTMCKIEFKSEQEFSDHMYIVHNIYKRGFIPSITNTTKKDDNPI